MNTPTPEKKEVTPSGRLYPIPPALITSRGKEGEDNIFTAAWVSQVCMNPPHIGVAIRPTRHSFKLIEESGEFGVNLPLTSQVRETDICGNTSGRELDKWELTGFSRQQPTKTSIPLIRECPVSIECKLTNTVEVGTHVLVIGEVVARHEMEGFDPGALLAYVSPDYRGIGAEKLGFYGFSKKE